jgi:hypothetical protein
LSSLHPNSFSNHGSQLPCPAIALASVSLFHRTDRFAVFVAGNCKRFGRKVRARKSLACVSMSGLILVCLRNRSPKRSMLAAIFALTPGFQCPVQGCRGSSAEINLGSVYSTVTTGPAVAVTWSVGTRKGREVNEGK